MTDRLLFVDVETNGMIARNLPTDHHSQPRIVQLGALLCRSSGAEELALNVLIKPDGWTISAKLVDIHHITTEQCVESGWPLKAALSYFVAMAKSAQRIVSHNTDFDLFMLEGELKRCGIDVACLPADRFCTMKRSTDLVKMPKARGNGWKYPTLAEAFQHFCHQPLENSHDAMVDTRACARIYFEIIKAEKTCTTTAP